MAKTKKGLILALTNCNTVDFNWCLYCGMRWHDHLRRIEETDRKKKYYGFRGESGRYFRVAIENDGVLYTFVKEDDTWKYAEDEDLPSE